MQILADLLAYYSTTILFRRIVSYKHSELTSVIINAFYQVYNALGYGFLEKVYERKCIGARTT